MEHSQKCLICTPLIASTVNEMLFQLQLAKDSGADVAELRVDHITDFNAESDLPALLKDRPLPVIVTPRAKWECKASSNEGFEGNEEARQDLLRNAYELGADYIDVELKVAGEFIKKLTDSKIKSSTKIIVSNHNWEFTPSQEEIDTTIEQMWAAGADIVKYVTTAKDITDVSRVFHFLSEAKGRPTIGLAMGPTGMISRLLSPKFGGYLTFGALSKGQESAPGQPTVQDLIEVYRVKSMDRDTVVCGVVGKPVYHSKGPILHNRGFAELNLNYVYVPFLVDDFAHFMSVYSESYFRGVSVTIPYKEDALRLCDNVEYLAKGIGAVNTVVREDGELKGYNTDCEGALSAIEDGLRHSGLATTNESPLKDKLFVVIGAGGAGKALAYGAKDRHARVAVANRNYERAKALAESIGAEAIELEKLSDFRPETGMILANSTSIGMAPEVTKSPISKDALSSYSLVFDAVYTPKETQLLKDATEIGAVGVSGEEMFYRQAFAQFKYFTGVPAPEPAMRNALSNPSVAHKGTSYTRTFPPRTLHVSAQCSIGVYNARGLRVSRLVCANPCERGWSFMHSAHFGILMERSQVKSASFPLRC